MVPGEKGGVVYPYHDEAVSVAELRKGGLATKWWLAAGPTANAMPACSFLNHGLLHEQLFFETSGEFFGVWERVKPIVPAAREMLRMAQPSPARRTLVMDA